jgi:hypothetical protein
VRVIGVVSPKQFYCQLISNKLELELLMSNMKEFYSREEVDQPVRTVNVVSGSFVAAKFSIDDGWYRAVVLSVSSEADVQVFFIDYGIQETVAVSDVRWLRDKFTSVPAMAFLCALDAFDDESDVIVAKFQQLVVNCQLVAHVVSQCAPSDVIYHKEKYVVKLFDMGTSVAERLSNLLVTQSSRVIVTSVASPNDFWCHIEDDASMTELPLLMDRIADLCGYVTPSAESNDEETSAIVDMKTGVICVAKYSDGIWYRAKILPSSVEPVNCELADTQKNATSIVRDNVMNCSPNGSGFSSSCSETEKNTYGTDEGNVDGSCCDDMTSVTSSNQFGGDSTHNEVQTGSLKEVTVSDPDNCNTDLPASFTRDTAKFVEVLFIDYGNSARVCTSNIRPLSSDYLLLPPQAVHCSLTSIQPHNASDRTGWDESSCNRFAELVMHRDDGRALEFRPSRVVRDANGHLVELFGRLYDGDIDVGMELVHGGYAVSSDEELQKSLVIGNAKRRRSSLLEHERCNLFVSPLQIVQTDVHKQPQDGSCSIDDTEQESADKSVAKNDQLLDNNKSTSAEVVAGEMVNERDTRDPLQSPEHSIRKVAPEQPLAGGTQALCSERLHTENEEQVNMSELETAENSEASESAASVSEAVMRQVEESLAVQDEVQQTEDLLQTADRIQEAEDEQRRVNCAEAVMQQAEESLAVQDEVQQTEDLLQTADRIQEAEDEQRRVNCAEAVMQQAEESLAVQDEVQQTEDLLQTADRIQEAEDEQRRVNCAEVQFDVAEQSVNVGPSLNSNVDNVLDGINEQDQSSEDGYFELKNAECEFEEVSEMMGKFSFSLSLYDDLKLVY